MKIFYKPAYSYLFIDLFMLIIWIFVILEWFPLTTDTPFDKYSLPAASYIVVWGFWSYILGRYQPLHKQHYNQSTNLLFFTSLLVLVFFHVLIFIYFLNKFSNNVLYLITAGEFTINYILLTIYFSYRYAVEYVEISFPEKEERFEAKVKAGIPLDDKTLLELHSNIKRTSGEQGLRFLRKNIQLEGGNTFVYSSKDPSILKYLPVYQFSAIIQLEKLNNIRGINKMLALANEILPEDGIFTCCYESKSTYKKIKLGKLPLGINYLVYSFDFLFKRVFPKLIFTRWFYFVFSGCKNRILSKAEVLGRLYCCGFKIEEVKKIGNLNYVLARRIKQPEVYKRKTYGPLIRLKRFGKNGKAFEVYKMRTMHPYSEYLQTYIFEKNNLQDGGKFNKDIRITTLGKYMRKYWLDEIPMILNLLKGEMKLVGVRPLSQQYFNLYSKELQDKRVKFKPGLLPPFYADMPKTLEEIQQSEMRYLKLCEDKSVITTDILYLFLIFKNILFKKARSA